MLDIMAFWLDLGIDGFRVDAVPYLIEREGTNCENLPETHAVPQGDAALVDEYYPGTPSAGRGQPVAERRRPLLWRGDEFHMAFNFPLMPRMFMAIRREDRRPIIESWRDADDPAERQWALFLRNHDELTLEMVTDEDATTCTRSTPRTRG